MIFVRTAGERDLAGIVAILSTTRSHTFNRALPEEGLRPDANPDPRLIQRLRADLEKPNSEFIVADDGQGGVDGMAFATFDPESRVVRLRQLFMRPDRQDPQIALALIEEIDGSFPEAQTLRVELDENQQAIDFYIEQGFAEVTDGLTPAVEGIRVFDRPILWLD